MKLIDPSGEYVRIKDEAIFVPDAGLVEKLIESQPSKLTRQYFGISSQATIRLLQNCGFDTAEFLQKQRRTDFGISQLQNLHGLSHKTVKSLLLSKG